MGTIGIPAQFATGKRTYYTTWVFNVLQNNTGATADLVTQITPNFDGKIIKTYWVQGTPASTGAGSATLNLEINGVNLSGGVVTLTKATCTPAGKLLTGTVVTGGNSFSKGDTVSVEYTHSVAFPEGNGNLFVLVAGQW